MKNYDLPNTCPHCGYKVDAASPVNDERVSPKSGDVTICIMCGSWSFFKEDMSLRSPTGGELIDIANNPVCRKVYAAWTQIKRAN